MHEGVNINQEELGVKSESSSERISFSQEVNGLNKVVEVPGLGTVKIVDNGWAWAIELIQPEDGKEISANLPGGPDNRDNPGDSLAVLQKKEGDITDYTASLSVGGEVYSVGLKVVLNGMSKLFQSATLSLV